MSEFKHLNRAGVWPSGNPRWYYRPKGEKGVALPDFPHADARFIEAYDDAAFRSFPQSTWPAKIDSALMQTLRSSRSRAQQRGREHSVTLDHVRALCSAQRARCALTGIKFDAGTIDGTRRRPFAPSLDRIDSDAGYVAGNVRLVTLIANIARADFGDAAFFMMCKSAHRNRPEIQQPPEVPI